MLINSFIAINNGKDEFAKIRVGTDTSINAFEILLQLFHPSNLWHSYVSTEHLHTIQFKP